MRYTHSKLAAFAADALIFLFLLGTAHAASNSVTGYFVIADSADQSSPNDINASVSSNPNKVPGITGAAVGPGIETPDLIVFFKGIFLRFFSLFS